MIFVDTHTHIADEAFKGEEEDIIRRAVDAGVTRMLQADIDSKERDSMFSIVEAHKGVLYPMLGLYPGSVDNNWQEEIYALDNYKDRGIVAIGEIGLDYHWSTEFCKEQKDALKVQLELASKMDLPVNIHLRDATEAFFDVLESCKGLPIRGNMHAYSGSYETYKRLQKYGDFSIGIGGVVTFKKASLAEVVKQVPIGHILLETDAPYLAPTPLRGTRNESANIPLIAAKIAELKGMSFEDVAIATTENAEKLFNL